MKIKTKQWPIGTGSATIEYDGQGDGNIIITSDANSLYEARSMQITVETTNGSSKQTKTITINQAEKQRIDLSAAVVTASNQTYSGSAKTPTPTVTLNGSVIPSTGYNVAYSNNINAGTANITITGKGDYTGTAYGTFTINKDTPSYTAPATRSLTYSGSSQYLTTSGSTSHGTIYYSTDGSNWYTSRRTRTNAGTYYCYWKLVGDSNHTDIGSTYLGTTSIAKASRTISWSSYPSSLYVGSKGTLSATASAGGSDGTISYSSSSSSKASVSGSTVTAVASGSCTIYATISEGTNYLSASTSYTLTVNAVPSGYVNMGLPSGLLWAEKNIGASSPYQYEGKFFSWGNTDGHEPTSRNSFGSYSWGTDNNTEPYVSSAGAALTGNIPLSQDAACANLGSPNRMPTMTEYKELFDNIKYINADGTEVSSSSTDKRVTVNGILGLYLESKINGNRLFFSCSGYGNEATWYQRGSSGRYWTSTFYSSVDSRILAFSPSGIYPKTLGARFLGFSVRAVRQ